MRGTQIHTRAHARTRARAHARTRARAHARTRARAHARTRARAHARTRARASEIGRVSIAAARYGLLSVDVKRVPVFPPSPFVFHAGPSCGFKGRGGLVNCASPVHAIGSLCCPLTVIDVTSGEGPFQSVFVSFPRCPFVTMASEQFSIQYDLW